MGIITDVQKTGAPERKTENILRRAAKCGEETGELLEAVLSVTSVSGAKGKQWMDVVEEACDIVIMGLDVALSKPPEWEDIDDAMWRAIVKKIIEVKLAKWKHQLRGGSTITAEGKLPKFSDEEHEAFLGLVADMKREPPETLSKPELKALLTDAPLNEASMHQPEGDDAEVGHLPIERRTEHGWIDESKAFYDRQRVEVVEPTEEERERRSQMPDSNVERPSGNRHFSGRDIQDIVEGKR